MYIYVNYSDLNKKNKLKINVHTKCYYIKMFADKPIVAYRIM